MEDENNQTTGIDTNLDTTQETFNINKLIKINVSGTIFEFPEHLIYNCTRLQTVKTTRIVDSKNRPYFFADPEVFRHVLIYLRSGELHLPLNACGVVNKQELLYWGLKPDIVERCCWNNLSFYNNERTTLKRFEKYLNEDTNEFNRVKQTKCTSTQQKLWYYITNPGTSKLATIYAILVAIIALLTVTVLAVETIIEYGDKQAENALLKTVNTNQTNTNQTKPPTFDERIVILENINLFCCIFFTVDLILRFFICARKIHFCLDFLNIVDLLSIASFYVEYVQEFIAGASHYAQRHSITNYARIFRILSVFRILRVLRFYFSFRVVIYTFRASYRDFLVMTFMILSGASIFGCLFFMVEDLTNVNSIPDGMYWAIVTITTVGYGDISPRTTGGKIIAAMCAVSGILTISFTIPLIVSRFVNYYQFASNPPKTANSSIIKHNSPVAISNSTTKINNNFIMKENHLSENANALYY